MVYGRLPGFPLSDLGRADAARLAGMLASAPVRAVYSSPLERATRTADLLAAPHGLQVTHDDRLLEWSFWSHWEGLPWSSIRERDPDILDRYAADPAGAWPQDPLARAGERILAWARDAEGERGEGGMVLGVSHEASLIAGLMVGSGRDLGGFHEMDLPHLSAIRLRPGPCELVDLVAWAGSC